MHGGDELVNQTVTQRTEGNTGHVKEVTAMVERPSFSDSYLDRGTRNLLLVKQLSLLNRSCDLDSLWQASSLTVEMQKENMKKR